MVLNGKWKVFLVLIFVAILPFAAIAAEQAVHFDKLMGFLPDPPSGWEADKPYGQMMSTPEGSWSMATREYTKGDGSTTVLIFDSANLQTVPYWVQWNTFYSYESSDGYAKTVKVGGYPAWEVYDKSSGEYTLFIGINKRFGVVVSTNTNRDTLYVFANSIDLKGIGAFGGAQPSQTPAPQPTQTPKPTPAATPTATATATPKPAEEKKSPGFELIAAILGISMAVVLKRRSKKN